MRTYKRLWQYIAEFFYNEKLFREKVVVNIKHTLFLITFFENCAVYEKMWKNILEPDRPQMTIWRMRIECCTPKATKTHSKYLILIAFPLQQWLHERNSVVRDTYIAFLVIRTAIQVWISSVAVLT